MRSIVKLQIIVIIQKKYRNTPQNICYLKYSIPNKYPIVFYNGSNYDYQYIIKELVEKFKKQLTCLGENIEKYIIFTVPIEKEVARIGKNGEQITKNLSYILQFIDSARFMTSSLSNLDNNLSERLHRTKFILRYDNKNCETCGIKYEYCDCFFKCIKDDVSQMVVL